MKGFLEQDHTHPDSQDGIFQADEVLNKLLSTKANVEMPLRHTLNRKVQSGIAGE